MTKEEMIKFAKGQYKIFPEDSYMGKYLRKTMKMLQAEPCGDSISREDVIKAVDRHTFDTDDGLCLDEDITIILEELSPVKHGCLHCKGKWIPVSERLPKPYTFVNATCRSLVDDRENWVVETLYLPIPKENNERGYSDWGNIPMLNWGEAEVIAWMERDIPKPYKTEIEGEKEMEKHTDRQIYDGCIHLMQNMVDYFQEYLDYLGYDLDKLDEDERFAVGMSNMEIVRQLFLQHTRNSGGYSTIDFCEQLEVDPYKSVKFEFEESGE